MCVFVVYPVSIAVSSVACLELCLFIYALCHVSGANCTVSIAVCLRLCVQRCAFYRK